MKPKRHIHYLEKVWPPSDSEIFCRCSTLKKMVFSVCQVCRSESHRKHNVIHMQTRQLSKQGKRRKGENDSPIPPGNFTGARQTDQRNFFGSFQNRSYYMTVMPITYEQTLSSNYVGGIYSTYQIFHYIVAFAQCSSDIDNSTITSLNRENGMFQNFFYPKSID